MSTRFGIHMGNSSIVLTVARDGKVDIVPSKFGDRVSSAVLALSDADEYTIGLPAKQGFSRNHLSTVINNLECLKFNEYLGKNGLKCGFDTETFQYELVKDELNVKISPQEVMVMFLQNIYENAKHAAAPDTALEAVLSVPQKCSPECRQNIIKAAEEAGFRVLQVVSHSTAATLAYDFVEEISEDPLDVLVLRMGGHTSDMSVVRIKDGLLCQLVSESSEHAAGNHITQLFANYVSNEFRQRYKLDPRESERTMRKLFFNVETCKNVLSTVESSPLYIESLMDGVDLRQNLSRARFESIIAPAVQQCVASIQQLLAKPECQDVRIRRIVLSGGSMKIPKLQSAIGALFPEATVYSSVAPDEAIAFGCVRQALWLGDKIPDEPSSEVAMELNGVSDDIWLHSGTDEMLVFRKDTIAPMETHLSVHVNKGLKLVQAGNEMELDMGQSDELQKLWFRIGRINADRTAHINVHNVTER